MKPSARSIADHLRHRAWVQRGKPVQRLSLLDAIAQSAVAPSHSPASPMDPDQAWSDFCRHGIRLHLAIGILGALYQREFTARAKHPVAMQEAVMNFSESRSLAIKLTASRDACR